MRIADRHEEMTRGSSRTRVCEAKGCSQTTREGKPYCSEHVELNPQAALIMATLARQEIDDSYVTRPGTPVSRYNIKGITAQAILQQLGEHGTRTYARLRRELTLDEDVLDGYAEALIREGLVVKGKTQRGNPTLALALPK
jgi:hypothetical protein